MTAPGLHNGHPETRTTVSGPVVDAESLGTGVAGTRAYDFTPDVALLRRVMARVEFSPNGCWIWTGRKGDDYPSMSIGGVMYKAHRVVMVLMFGPVSPELDVDHWCRNRRCVNPAHLDIVTRGENVSRTLPFRPGSPHPLVHRHPRTPVEPRTDRTHCRRGHEYGPKDIDRDGYRDCRRCKKIRWQKHVALRRAAS